MRQEQPQEWQYIGRAGRRRRWRRLRSSARALQRGLASGLDALGTAMLGLGRWLCSRLRTAIIGRGPRRRIGLTEALVWLAAAAAAGAFLLLLSQQMLALALVLALLGVAYALREMR